MDDRGMTYAAEPEVVALPKPVPIELIDKVLGHGAGSYAGVLRLIYRIVDTGAIQELLLADVLHRITVHEIAKAVLIPAAVRRRHSTITDIKFSTEVSLNVQQAVALQQRGVVFVAGCQLIRPRGRVPYFRDTPDRDPSNNLEVLPNF